MQDICRRIDTAKARLGQCLLAPDDHAETNLLLRHGFEQAADMFFLARGLSASDVTQMDCNSGDDPMALSIETYQEANADRFAQVVEGTYQGSLDCPYLTGFRTATEAIASHKLSGEFDPSKWALFSVNGRDAGVVLLNDHPDQDAVELVYFGVVPAERGKGLGRRMLRKALSESARRGRAAMFLAVDCENRFANALYGEFAFVELARRRVMLRQPARLAR
jgi:ribosomal protein S18 acetylase RimI-like enzyme